MTFREYLELPLLTLQRMFGAIISRAWVIGKRLNFFERRNFMTELNNRVLTRTGARILTEAEMARIGGAFSTSVIITDVLTNFGKDFSVDHLES